MAIGDAKPGDPTQTLQQVAAASGCGFRWQGYLPVDPVACSAMIKSMMNEHMPHCGLCQQEAKQSKA